MVMLGGDPTYAADINAFVPQLVGQTTLTSDGTALSGSTEASQGTVTINAVSGKRYEIRFFTHVSSATAADTYQAKIREDSGIAGTQIALSQLYCATTSTVGFAVSGWGQWTASSTASKTFSLTLQRNGSSGTGQLRASSTKPTYFQVWTAP